MEHINLQPDSVQTLLCSHDYEQQIQSHLLLYERTAKASPHSDLTAQPPPVEGWGVAFMWPQNFRARLIFHSKLQNSWCCSHPEHSHHLWHSSRNTPWQGKEDSLPCLFMNICERSTASKRADNTTFKLGRQIALIPRNKKNNKALKIHTSTTLLPALFVCHYFPPHRLSGTQTPPLLQTRHCLQVASEASSLCLHWMNLSDQLTAIIMQPKGRNKNQVNKLW